jgi:hypothetical protein
VLSRLRGDDRKKQRGGDQQTFGHETVSSILSTMRARGG